MHDMKAIRDAINNVDFTAGLYDPRSILTREQAAITLAAFVRDITDETPADREWLEQVTPNCYDGPAFRCSKRGEYTFHQDTDDGVILEGLVTRGRVRLFALAMRLELREVGSCAK